MLKAIRLNLKAASKAAEELLPVFSARFEPMAWQPQSMFHFSQPFGIALKFPSPTIEQLSGLLRYRE